jgi:Tol biopolymer transport system component
MALMAIIAMAAAAIIAHKWTRRSSEPILQTMKITKLTESGKIEYVAISPDGRYVAYAQQGSDGQALRLRQVGTESDIQILAPEDVSFLGITFSADGSDIYFIRANPGYRSSHKLFVIPMLGGRPRPLMEDVDSPISFSPEGRRFVFTRGVPAKGTSEVRIANADGSGDHLLATMSDTFTFFQPGAAWSPDGRTIAAAFVKKGMAGWTLVAVQAGDGGLREMYDSVRSIGSPRWLPDGSGLLVTLDDPLQLGQLWIIPFPRGKPRRVTNDISNYDPFIDATPDAKAAVALSQSVVHNLWEAPASDPSVSHQLTTGAMPYAQLVTTSDGKLVARSWDGELWIMNADGGERARIPGVSNAATLASCGRFLLTNSYSTAADELIRFDADGTNINVMATGQSYGPTCSPDGRIAYYLELTHPQKILRIPIEGGIPEKVADVASEGLVGLLSISPDGSLLAYLYDTYSPEPARKIAIIPVDASAQVKTLNAPPGAARLTWSPDGKSLRFLRTQEGIWNLWEQLLAGGELRQLTHFTSDSIVDYASSRDGHQLFFIRGYVSSDVVLLRNFR